MRQIITPNPNIPCKPGWCLAYVNEAFGVPKRFGSATAAWLGSSTQHRDRNFPAGVWLPVWYGIEQEPLGHVVLMAPDGSVYSTSDLSNKPYHHPNLAHLEAFYARYGMTLTYRGWTEDVEGTPVIDTTGSLTYAGTITPLEEDMALSLEDKQFIQNEIERRHLVTRDLIRSEGFSYANKVFIQDAVESRATVTRDVIRTAVSTLATFTPGIDSEKLEQALQAAVTQAVTDGLAAGIKIDATVKVAGQ